MRPSAAALIDISLKIVNYLSEREDPNAFVDQDGNDAHAPMMHTKHGAHVVDTGEWKYVFSVGPVPGKDLMEAITEGIQEFKAVAGEPK